MPKCPFCKSPKVNPALVTSNVSHFCDNCHNWFDEAQAMKPSTADVRYFSSGATRDTDQGKFDYEGFLSPLVIERYGQFMHKHRLQSDGKLRDSDNWQKGLPLSSYIKSLWRHFLDLWKIHRGLKAYDNRGPVELEDAACAILFNTMGYLHEYLKAQGGASAVKGYAAVGGGCNG